MFRLDKIIKPWKDAGSLNANVNLYGFWDETTFLTKSGDLGVVLKIGGVDFESLDQASQEFAVKRLEAALKAFGPGFHIYQYLFKTNRPEMPFAHYGDPLIDARSTSAATSSSRSATGSIRLRSSTPWSLKVSDQRLASASPSAAPKRSERSITRAESAVHRRQHEGAPTSPDRTRPVPAGAEGTGISSAIERYSRDRGTRSG